MTAISDKYYDHILINFPTYVYERLGKFNLKKIIRFWLCARIYLLKYP